LSRGPGLTPDVACVAMSFTALASARLAFTRRRPVTADVPFGHGPGLTPDVTECDSDLDSKQ
jgi:hypothetical protein